MPTDSERGRWIHRPLYIKWCWTTTPVTAGHIAMSMPQFSATPCDDTCVNNCGKTPKTGSRPGWKSEKKSIPTSEGLRFMKRSMVYATMVHSIFVTLPHTFPTTGKSVWQVADRHSQLSCVFYYTGASLREVFEMDNCVKMKLYVQQKLVGE